MAHLSAYPDEGLDQFLGPKPSPRASASGWYLRITTTCLVVAGLMVLGDFALGWTRALGEFDGRTADPTPVTIRIGKERLAIPANMFRFENQRSGDVQDHVELVVRWPTLQGYDAAHRNDFLNGSVDAPLLFLTIHKRDSTSDTAGRLASVYRHFFDEESLPAPEGLVGHRLSVDSGLGGEQVFFEAGSTEPFATHCLPADASGYPAPCLTEIHAGDDISVQLRFRVGMLKNWSGIKSGSRVLLASFGLTP